jgi:hypothetical protein
LAEEFRLHAESEWGRRAGIEDPLPYELEAQERAVIGTQLLAAESRPQAVEAARRHRVEAEARLIEAAARLQDEHEDSAWDEEEPQRLVERIRKRSEQQAIRLAEAEAQLREEEGQLQRAQETRRKGGS